MEILEDTTTTSAAAETTDKKRRLDINFDDLFGEGHDKIDDEIVVVPATSRRSQRRRKSVTSVDPPPPAPAAENDFLSTSDSELKSAIERQEKNLPTLCAKLPDGGVKLKAKLQAMKDELERRQNPRSQEVAVDGYTKPSQSESSSIKGGTSNEGQSKFATHFLDKLDNDFPKTGHNTINQGNKELNNEISFINPCDKKKAGGKLPQIKNTKPGLHFKEFSAWTPVDKSRNGEKYARVSEKLAARVPSSGSLPLLRQKSSGSFTDEDDSQALDTNGSKNEETVVLVDEEEPEHTERKQDAKELPSSRLSESKIYYPSREDSESLEIFRSELKCLEPGECLTSTIMNFYVRYLQERCSDNDNFYFFNTYFYSKLQEAMECQRNDKEAFFMKFRRWWKGVNIFQKAYIFLPINEDNHWSLVIICIPDKEDESELVVLHLDSLGLHCSSTIFRNIKSLLINEWKILNEDVGFGNAPLPEKIWKNLSRRIDQKSIEVPRQNNDYDCGLFVLYYMEVFINEATERLTKQNPFKFGKNWFKPQEASSLRKKIKGILQEKFREALEQDNHTFVPVCLSTKSKNTKTVYF